jgi:predicted CopG family antitoxin
MPQITVSDETLERLDRLAEEGQTHDEVIVELMNILQMEESTLFAAGDED